VINVLLLFVAEACSPCFYTEHASDFLTNSTAGNVRLSASWRLRRTHLPKSHVSFFRKWTTSTQNSFRIK